MSVYIIRRIFYGILVLIGVNFFTFLLFFAVNTPDDMARLAIGGRRVTTEAIEKWKVERGYDKPLLINQTASGTAKFTDTVFFERSIPLFVFDFGSSDGGRDITHEVSERVGPSLALALPTFVLGVLVSVLFSLLLVFFRGTYLDFWGVVLCVALLSISSLFYIIAGQYLFSKVLRLVPLSGFEGGISMVKFLALPVLIGIVSRLGPEARFYRTLFLGSLIAESFFGIPGLGSYTMDAINAQDFSVVRAMTFIGSTLYIIGLLLADISYTIADPRVRFE